MAEYPNQDSSGLRAVLVFPTHKLSFFATEFFFPFFLPHLKTWYCVCLSCALGSSHSLSHQSKQIPTHLTITDCSVLSSVHWQMRWMYCSEIKLQEFKFSAWCSVSLKSQVQSVSILLFQREKHVIQIHYLGETKLLWSFHVIVGAFCNWEHFKLCWSEGERDTKESLLRNNIKIKVLLSLSSSGPHLSHALSFSWVH